MRTEIFFDSLSQVRNEALYARYSGVSLKDFRSSLAIGRALPGMNDRETRSGQSSPAGSRTPTRSSKATAATTSRTPPRSTGSASKQPDVTPTRASSRLSNASRSSARKASQSSPTKQSASASKRESTPVAPQRQTSASQRARNDLMNPSAGNSSKRAREVEPEDTLASGSPSKAARTTPGTSRMTRTNTPSRSQSKRVGEVTPKRATQEEAEEARRREADRQALDAADAEEAARAQRIRSVPRVPWDFELGQAKWDVDEEWFEVWRQETFASLRARQVMAVD